MLQIKKSFFLYISFCFSQISSYSQEAFVSCGESEKNRVYGEVSYSLGEPFSCYTQNNAFIQVGIQMNFNNKEIEKISSEKNISIWHNKTKEAVYVQIPEGDDARNYMVYDDCGRKCLSGSLVRSGYISVDFLAKGQYLLRIDNDNKKGFVTFKLVKE